MENLGLHAQHATDRISVDSVEMSDGTRDHYGQQRAAHPAAMAAAPNHYARGQPQQQQQQQHHLQRPTSTASNVLSPTPSHASSTSRKTSSRYNLNDFTFIRTLGTGSFGRVHLVRSQHNSRSYAIKVLSKERVVKMKQVEHTNSEREMLERVRHPFLVNLWGTFKDSRNLYMVMDFVAGGELFSLLRKSQVSRYQFARSRWHESETRPLTASASPILWQNFSPPKSHSRSTTFTRSISSTVT